MKVHGVITLNVSMDIEECENYQVAAYYKLNEVNIDIDTLHIQDAYNNLHCLNVHAITIDWDD